LTLKRLELLTLRADDGLATPEELLELSRAGVDIEEWSVARTTLLEVLADPSPEIADDVLIRIEADHVHRGLAISAVLKSNHKPDLVKGVLSALNICEKMDVGLDLRAGVDEADCPDLSDAVLSSLGFDEDIGRLSLGEFLREDDDPVNLWDGISGELQDQVMGDEVKAAVIEAAGSIDVSDAVMSRVTRNSRSRMTPLSRRTLMGGMLAAAAALLLVVSPNTDSSFDDMELALGEFSDVNEIEIEDLESSPDTMVQIFQLEQGAPTIIFIDELVQNEFDDAEGVPL